jgi:hypothetical protein
MALIDIQAFRAIAEEDFEFNREMRYFDGRIRVDVGDGERHVMEFKDGRLVDISDADVPHTDCKIHLKGTREQWSEMLQRFPRPFYHSIQSTCVKHGMLLSNSNETFAYLPALNRMMQILRNVHNKE